MTTSKFRIALLCGGPSLERGISLNSARCVCDHLHTDTLEIVPIYFDRRLRTYEISRGQLYSNTPSDFDFKIDAAKRLSRSSLESVLRKVDLVFPLIHGKFGEGGEVQSWLERLSIPYVGPTSTACRRCFDKYKARAFLNSHGYHTVPTLLIRKSRPNWRAAVDRFFETQKLSRAIVKPSQGGSSIAVHSVSSVAQACHKIEEIFLQRIDDRIVVEPFSHGREFTVIVLENTRSNPVALVPCEIELGDRGDAIFDYRRKYLPTRQVTYHCPPQFEDEVVERIQLEAERLYSLIGLRDFTRLDGWLLPDGKIWFSDINTISGMDQNSFLFIQAARMGMSHRDVLQIIVRNACRRFGAQFPDEPISPDKGKLEVQVLFGGKTAERQVSMMSGTNVWLKLRRSEFYDPKPFLLESDSRVWQLPYSYTLNHTVEEVLEMCRNAESVEARLVSYRKRFHRKMLQERAKYRGDTDRPKSMELEKFIESASFVFIALHGGFGENGGLQSLLESKGVPFNGSGSKTSRLCMNKLETSRSISHFTADGILTAKKTSARIRDIERLNSRALDRYWDSLVAELSTERIIVKPIDDGCSSGIAALHDAGDLKRYIAHAAEIESHIPSGTLTGQEEIVEMPSERMDEILFEEFIETDRVAITDQSLDWDSKGGWVEITVGVLEDEAGLKSLSPSITVVEGSLLSLEEKFQGGTGVNITPPPTARVPPETVEAVKTRIEKVATALKIRGYARIDAFMHIETGEIIVIEANTIPGLTPSTVIFQQALAEDPPLYPTAFLERITQQGMKRAAKSKECPP